MRNIIKGHLLYVSFFLFLTFACKEDVKPEPNREEACFKKAEKEGAIEAILKSEDVQYYIHPEYSGQLPLNLVKSYLITPDLKIKSNKQQVVFSDSLIPDTNMHRIRFSEVDCHLKKAEYSVWDANEHAVITGTIQMKDSVWIATTTSVGIVD